MSSGTLSSLPSSEELDATSHEVLDAAAPEPLTKAPAIAPITGDAQQTTYRIIFAVAVAHFINDTVQATLPAMFPILKTGFSLSFAQIGVMTFVTQITASLLQPAVGLITDKRPVAWLLPLGMTSTIFGVLALAYAGSYPMLLVACALIGIGSSTFHPEASRIARMASGGRFGFAQSTFQFGGNAGTAIGPLIAAAFILPFGRERVLIHLALLAVGIFVLKRVSEWYAPRMINAASRKKVVAAHNLTPTQVYVALLLLGGLVFSKNVYSASLINYFAFFLMERFQLEAPQAQVYLFLFLGASAVGTLIGGPIGDRIGRKKLIWISILGAAPFTLLLPYANLFWTGVLAVVIGLIISSAFSAIVVFAQELMPQHVGLIAGIFFGLAFGFAGISAGLLGKIADLRGLGYVFWLTSFMPLLGIVAAFLPNIHTKKAA